MSNLPEQLTELSEAVAGLLVISETDAPLELFVWPAPLPCTAEALLAASGQSAATFPIQTLDALSFFTPMMTEQDWQDDAEQAQARRFRSLYKWLNANLTALTVYRLGEISIDTFIVGQTSAGRFVGLSTRQVET